MPPISSAPDRAAALWHLARRRTKFKAHLQQFLLLNATFWGLWALTSRHSPSLPWPAFITFFWGLALLRDGLAAYGAPAGRGLLEREYDRLTRPR